MNAGSMRDGNVYIGLHGENIWRFKCNSSLDNKPNPFVLPHDLCENACFMVQYCH